MSVSTELNWRSMPLDGTTLIEASAGTGKTYNIALLYLRLLIEQDLSARQILVTTFTEAAAQELKARIRLRLLSAERYAAAGELSMGSTDDPVAAYIAEQLSIRGSGPLLACLRAALADIDLAPISTIHGFCRRVLSDFPFEAGASFVMGEVVDEAYILLIALAVAALLLLLRSVRRLRTAAPGQAAAGDGAIAERPSRRNLLLALALTVGYAVGLIGQVPYEIATGAFVFLFIAVFEWESGAESRRRLLRLGTAALQAVLVAGIVAVTFEYAFLVRLP